MDDLDVVLTCPLGSVCSEVKGNKIYRCVWSVKMQGIDSSGNEHDKWNCSIAWMPILQTEMSGTNRGQTAAIESLRNGMIKKQGEAIAAMKDIKQIN